MKKTFFRSLFLLAVFIVLFSVVGPMKANATAVCTPGEEKDIVFAGYYAGGVGPHCGQLVPINTYESKICNSSGTGWGTKDSCVAAWTDWTPVNNQCGITYEQTRTYGKLSVEEKDHLNFPFPHEDGYQETRQVTNPACPIEQCNVISDATNIVEGGTNAVVTWNHPNWADEMTLGSAAEWIWETFNVLSPTTDETKVFVKEFNLDSSPTSANIKIAADNGFKLEINGNVIDDKMTVEHNYESIVTDNVDLSYLKVGPNTIRMTVENFGLADATSESNPAGALYSLHVEGSTCEGTTPTDMCLNIDGYQSIVPEGMERNSDGNCAVPSTDMCPNEQTDPGIQTEGPCNSDDVCPNDEGIQTNLDQCTPEPILGCMDSSANNYNVNATESNSSCTYTRGGGSSGFFPNGGQVLGVTAPVGQVLGAETQALCSFSIDTYMRKGYKNNTEQVKVLQWLLNKYADPVRPLAIDGMFGPKTEALVRTFQLKYKENILTPWKLTGPTGIFFRTTLVQAKNLECPAEILPIPTDLINWSQSPGATPFKA